MKPEIKQRWIDALRSGGYRQTQYSLSDGRSFCCLGVLCDVVKDEVDGQWIWSADDLYFSVGKDKSDINPLPAVLEYVGLLHADLPHLVNLNDEYDYDFEGIAHYIEEEL